jgi:glycosyltransferase involved in cell wall biosynthesis
VNKFSVIIPSRNIGNLTACVRAIREAGETCRIIVVDDGIEWSREDVEHVSQGAWGDAEVCLGISPFIFSRNINEGIIASETDDVVLLNDDAILRTPRGFTALQACCHVGSKAWGAISPGFTPGSVGTQNLVWRGRPKPVEEKIMLVFACVYIPRTTIGRVGLLDERFGINAGGPGVRGYGLEDDDYSLRIRQTGLRLGVYDGVLVDHLPLTTGLKSTFRHDPEHPHDVRAHEDLFTKIHGHWPEGHGFAPGKGRK